MVATATSLAPANFKSYQERKFMSEESSTDNYTKISNAFLDEIMGQIESVSELKVVMAIFRLTAGFQKKSDQISYTRFQKLTGLTPSSVSDGIKLALAHGLIEREPAGQQWRYSLKPLAPGYRLDKTASPRLVVPLAPGECFDEKPLAPGYTQKKKNLKEKLNKSLVVSDETTEPADSEDVETIQEKQTKPSSRHVEMQAAASQSNPGERPGAGRDSPFKRPGRQAKPKEKEPDARLEDPRMKVWRKYADLAGYGPWPNELQRQHILDTVQRDNLTRW